MESNNPNECPNLFKRRKKVLNECPNIFALRNPQIFGLMNIFVNKYLNIFEYPFATHWFVQ